MTFGVEDMMVGMQTGDERTLDWCSVVCRAVGSILLCGGCIGAMEADETRSPEEPPPAMVASPTIPSEPATDHQVDQGEPEPPRGARISLTRTSCLGACPDYTLTIRPDGRVVFVGRAFVATVGRASGRIDRGQVGQMLERLERLDFFQLEDCVDRVDVPQLIVEVDDGTRAHRVAILAGCAGHGVADLVAAANDFEDAAGSRVWIGHVVPCGFGIRDEIYFLAHRAAISDPSREIVETIAEVLQSFAVPTTIVGSRTAGEPRRLALERALAVRDALVAAGVAPDTLTTEASASVARGHGSVRFEVRGTACEEGQQWPWITVPDPAP
jgi:Domain of unknown function (DUF6438)